MSINLTASPTGATESKSFLSGIDVQTSPTFVEESDYEELTPEDSINIIVGVFFDGTLNNRLNAQAGAENRKKKEGLNYNKDIEKNFISTSGEDNSFYNDESNVSKLEPFYPKTDTEKDKYLSVYMEGIGTEDYEDDSTLGFAFGTGSTGIEAKVKLGCEKVAEKISKKGEKKIHTLTIDSFGFSRGAAAARHFVFEITKKKGDIKSVISSGGYGAPVIIKYQVDKGHLGEQLTAFGLEVRTLVIRFVGLYDTVPSMGLPMNHKNNVSQLGLDAIRKANHVVQLAAADEHRSNFSLTNINSASNKGKEVPLPGVHSDIGGGYIDNAPESVKIETSGYLPTLDKERNELINQGWYLPGQITVDKTWGQLWGNRAAISNKYSIIPLQMMCKFGIDKGKVLFEKGKLERSYSVSSPLLITVKSRLFDYAFNGGNNLTFDADKILMKKLRNEYFHYSAHYNGFWDPMKPRYKDGQRTRQIFNG